MFLNFGLKYLCFLCNFLLWDGVDDDIDSPADIDIIGDAVIVIGDLIDKDIAFSSP